MTREAILAGMGVAYLPIARGRQRPAIY